MIQKLLTLSTLALVFPLTAFAQSGGINTAAITPYSNGIINVINTILIPVLFAIALFMFILGVFRYFILGAADDKSRQDGRKFVLWALIGFVVILSVWGLVYVLQDAFGLSGSSNVPNPPTINFGGSTSGSASNPSGSGSSSFGGGGSVSPVSPIGTGPQ